MLFNTLSFIIFNFICVFLFWSTKSLKIRNLVMLSGSLFFYAWYYWPALFLLLLMMLINYFLGLKIEQTGSKKILTLGVITNLSTLAFFKYSKFFIENIITLASSINIKLVAPEFNYWLPLGISFYTFQIIAYLVDVYRKEIKAEKSFIQFAVFKAFYGQLIAGPIVRAKNFLPQLKTVNPFKPELFHLGLYYLLAGLFIKIVVADTLSQFVDFAFNDPTQLNFSNAWFSLYGFAVQILADFWGYSTIAIGIGYFYGIHLPINFNNPYLSASIRDFWRRWHITLSIWLRDYLYISLGGNRNHRYRNLMLTMGLGGLWHGASWNFVLWGIGHGLWLVIERLGQSFKYKDQIPKLIKQFIVFNGVCLLWVFFRAQGFSQATRYFQALLGQFQSTIKVPGLLFIQLGIFIIFLFFFEKSLTDKRFLKWSLKKQVLISLTYLLFILSYANAKLDFIYFEF